MLLSQETKEKFGYFPEDLGMVSKRKVVVKCDYCGDVFERAYDKFNGGHKIQNKDACRKEECLEKKTTGSFVEKYGVERPGSLVVPYTNRIRINSKTGVAHETKAWTPEEIQYMKDNYQNKTCAEMAKELDRGVRSVQHTFAALGLKRNKASIGDVFNGWEITDIYMAPLGAQNVSMAKVRSIIEDTDIEREFILSKLRLRQVPWPDNRRPDNTLRNTKHGMTRTRIYRIWSGMKNRCNDANIPQFKDYGGRGIKVCEEWNDFIPFAQWAEISGYDDSLTIDRIDVDGNYEPGNCRWSTKAVQTANKRNSNKIIVTAYEETKSIYEWAADLRCAVTYQCLLYRINKGWEPEKALTQPSERMRKPNTQSWLEVNHPEIYKEWEIS